MKRRNSKYPQEKALLAMLDATAKKFGLAEVRHAVNKWGTAQREKAALAKARKVLEARLADVDRRLAR